MRTNTAVIKLGGTTAGNPARLAEVKQLVKSGDDGVKRIGVITSAPAVGLLRATELLKVLANLSTKKRPESGVRANCFAYFQGMICAEIDENSIWSLVEALYVGAFKGHLSEKSVQNVMQRHFERITSQKVEYDQWCAEIVGSGEIMMAELLSEFLGLRLIDAYACTRVGHDGHVDWRSTRTRARELHNGEPFVMAGFAASDSKEQIRTLPSGGTDITAALIACALPDVSMLEVWKEVDGVLRGDPRILELSGLKPELIDRTVHRAVREVGAQPLHADALRIVRRHKPELSVRVCNVDKPDAPGTWIVPQNGVGGETVTMMDGKTGMTALNVGFEGFNQATGALARITAHFQTLNIPIEHVATGIDSVMFTIPTQELPREERRILEAAIRREDRDVEFRISDGLAVICVVGETLGANNVTVLADIFCALRDAGISAVRHVDVGGSSFGIVIGLHEDDYKTGYVAIYNALFATA